MNGILKPPRPFFTTLHFLHLLHHLADLCELLDQAVYILYLRSTAQRDALRRFAIDQRDITPLFQVIE